MFGLPFNPVPAVVAIPVRDEAERIADCLLALAGQAGPAPGVVLLVNNTTDATVRVVREMMPAMGLQVRVIEHVFPAAEAHAGAARRLAMQAADALAPPGVPLLTTDADGRAEPDWLAANLRHLRHGLDAVFGRAVIDPVEAARIPPALHEADARECAYAAVLDEIASLLDPDEDDPWPRHAEQSGASIAVTRAAFRQAGGIPPVRLGEDRAFHAALRRIGARIRHAPEVAVVVSGRILGRAAGGMADTIRRRLVAPDTMLDEALEPAGDRVRRLRLRAAVRHAFSAGPAAQALAEGRQAGLAFPQVAAALGRPGFTEAWADLDAALPMARVAVAELPSMMAQAVSLRDALRQERPQGAGGAEGGAYVNGPSTRCSSVPMTETLYPPS